MSQLLWERAPYAFTKRHPGSESHWNAWLRIYSFKKSWALCSAYNMLHKATSVDRCPFHRRKNWNVLGWRISQRWNREGPGGVTHVMCAKQRLQQHYHKRFFKFSVSGKWMTWDTAKVSIQTPPLSALCTEHECVQPTLRLWEWMTLGAWSHTCQCKTEIAHLKWNTLNKDPELDWWACLILSKSTRPTLCM